MAEAVPTEADLHWLREAIKLSAQSPPSGSAFSVGAVLVAADGSVIATGYSRETDPHDHAEEVALARVPGAGDAGLSGTEAVTARLEDAVEGAGRLAGATMYTSLEPCRTRLSRPRSCAELIARAGIRRVVLAWREPPLFVPGGGAAWLREQGVTVLEVRALAEQARAINAHLLPG